MARTSAATSEYERARQEKIAKNQALLRDLALDAASAGIAPSARKAASNGAAKKKKPAPKKIKEEDIGPRRTSSRLRGIVADSEVAKRKAEDEHEALREAERAKRQRVSGDINLGDALVAGNDWTAIADIRASRPYERTFDAKKETSDKELQALREKMSSLELWEDFTPNEIKITPERIYAMSFHPTTDKPLVLAGDKMGNLGICDCSPQAPAVKKEEDSDDEDDRSPAITTLKIHTRTISALQCSPSSAHHIYSSSYDSTIRRMDLNKGVAVEIYAPPDPSHDAPLSGIEVHPSDPHTVYFTTLDGSFGHHDTRTPSTETASSPLYQLCEKKIGGFSLHPTSPHVVATASLDRTLKLWDLRKIAGKGENALPALLGEHESRLSVSHAAFAPSGHLATSSYDDTVKIYDFATAGSGAAGLALSEAKMAPVTVVPHNNQTGRWVTILRPQWQRSPVDGVQRFVIGNMNRFVDVYTASGQQLAQLGDPELITAVPAVAQFHPERDWVAAGTASGKLCLWM
ncbi:WD repeat-containing protein [Pseudovirgaria hyperparasitica]|uniref:DNA damage-binding protein CMR1 n=1 Tax=Pseudovirgaria hyperparasitica TaxID=470096 RepID=A0A6A6VU09_9PEZI|nr:WD repeat-containing protein [Pseudovirgaria hyperparasitica]KAF2753635.1 WD repeat-containing protein [Pseudovirgaria hyperparasitica]